MTQPWFFAHLGLDPTEDTGAIRRAYAVALKRIDQAQEREAFERLRDAYQRALDWARDPSSRDEADEPDYWEEEDELPSSPDLAPPDPAPPDPAPLATPATPVGVVHAEIDPGIDLAAEADRRDAAVADRIGRLLSVPATELAAEFDAALDDPDLAHLDARDQFETGLLEALHEDPAGRLALFEIAAERLDWRRDHAKLGGDWMANAWADRVIDQADHWAALPRLVRRRHDYLLRRVARWAAPGPIWLLNDGPILATLQEEYPDWLELRLPPGRFDAWQAAREALSARWVGLGRFLRAIDPRRISSGRLIAIILAAAVLISFAQGWRKATQEPVASDEAVTVPAESLDHVLAYEITGPNDREACGLIADFATGSNWLAVDDSLAQGLLATRILDCRMRGLWPTQHDGLVDCLRSERLSALQADRPENLTRCEQPAADTAQ